MTTSLIAIGLLVLLVVGGLAWSLNSFGGGGFFFFNLLDALVLAGLMLLRVALVAVPCYLVVVAITTYWVWWN